MEGFGQVSENVRRGYLQGLGDDVESVWTDCNRLRGEIFGCGETGNQYIGEQRGGAEDAEGPWQGARAIAG